jgi:hypothetical protein
VDLVILSADGSNVTPFEVTLQAGKNTVCLPATGSYIVTPKGCYIFNSKTYDVTVTRDTPTPLLKLTASRAYVDGVIRVTSPASSDDGVTSSSLPETISIGTITAEPADSVAEAGIVAKATQLNPESEPGVYTYTLALDLGSTVMVEPVQPDGGALIFNPTRTRYQMVAGMKGCPDSVPEIGAHVGVVVSGATNPAVAGKLRRQDSEFFGEGVCWVFGGGDTVTNECFDCQLLSTIYLGRCIACFLVWQ